MQKDIIKYFKANESKLYINDRGGAAEVTAKCADQICRVAAYLCKRYGLAYVNDFQFGYIDNDFIRNKFTIRMKFIKK